MVKLAGVEINAFRSFYKKNCVEDTLSSNLNLSILFDISSTLIQAIVYKKADQAGEQEEAVIDQEMLRTNFCEITKMLGDGYVQYCCKSDGSTYPSNFALYFNDHLIDMYTLARKGGNLWHVSRMTLCPGVYLTTISYQNPKVLKKSKCVRPIFMGPILIHTCVSEQVPSWCF